jgi:hypothetical protein
MFPLLVFVAVAHWLAGVIEKVLELFSLEDPGMHENL